MKQNVKPGSLVDNKYYISSAYTASTAQLFSDCLNFWLESEEFQKLHKDICMRQFWWELRTRAMFDRCEQSEGHKWQLMTKISLPRQELSPQFIPEVARQHDVFARAITFDVFASFREFSKKSSGVSHRKASALTAVPCWGNI